MLDSRSLPPVSAVDLTEAGLSAVVSAVVDVVGSIDIGGNPFTLAIDSVARTAYIIGGYVDGAKHDAATARSGVVMVDLDSAKMTTSTRTRST
ncbi:hypothetical protein ACFXHA_07070 [Nocardia sp. NPDC059240]|uniref:hypothetical protein n=1 Tax=Nocardia sp. NPDC059240 TaxID=3346786 RepID=UPI0036CCFFAD